jgi:neutral trehalase
MFFLWFAIASCTQPVVFDRDNLRDPENPDYTPATPSNLRLERNGFDYTLRWFTLAKGIDSIRVEKTVDMSTYQTLAIVSDRIEQLQHTTSENRNILVFRVTAFYRRGDVYRVSDSVQIRATGVHL